MRKKTQARRESFIKAAGELFIAHGFNAVTMESIAGAAKASKVTLYNYFPSKELLFEAFVIEAGKGVPEAMELAKEETDLRRCLSKVGHVFIEITGRPEIVRVNRLIISEAERAPQLSRIFYENGPRRAQEAVRDILVDLMERKLLRTSDPLRAADIFVALCNAGIMEKQLWCIEPPPALSERQTAVEEAVNIFISVYGKK
ncbi:TetR/AcrR family transcriptional regulator [Acetobacter sp.]|jgi:AcrR family transcriptional regulator|uniref:TetR/AcrR family transcriptional regulator n=1 Tax=Acetobacter sp. TaxID=440 RepID=UPI0025BA0843|nr:TetR/AcrR family transcriptional regulator [Acetobacter sp.]MCH4089633.1 TetR/AcrR family transcriptional regulator [Acetobacter sp.]MCI1300613.1 TetR/AcrR family transcriptional regulator [Acetobacter sp.]MCI1317007.1 TetR/AcrR family transcriptional regulator [Acetobacter sp.]